MLKKIGFDVIRERVAAHCLSEAGRQKALALLPRGDRKGAAALLSETKEAEHLLIASPSLPISSFSEVGSELSRLRAGAGLSCAELLRVALLHKAARRAANALLKSPDTPILTGRAEALRYDEELISRIDTAILSEEEVSDNASPALRSIRRKMKSEQAEIREKLSTLIRSKEHASHLQESIITMREGRFVVPVKQEYKGSVPGLIHAESRGGGTLFIEPLSVVEANNRLRILEGEEQAEIERILMELSDLARPGVADMEEDAEILAELDLIFAKAQEAVEERALPGSFNTEGVISIRSGRHPLIDKNQVIPVSVTTGKDIRTLIITGPNTGGKTVTLKLIGLFAAMGQSGLFLPALEGTSLPVFSAIFADIGDEQSIEQSLSTFSAHMKNVIFILRKAGSDSLVLLDELGAGTDPEEGTSLALAVLDELYERGAHTFATTHYGEIKAYAMKRAGFDNASMEFDATSLQPTFKLLMGVAGASNAFFISRRLGLKSEIIEKARGFMREERLEFDKLLLEAERTRKDAERRLTAAEEKERAARELEKKAKELQAELDKKRAEAIAAAKEEAARIVKESREEMELVMKEARRLRNMSESEATKLTEDLRTIVSSREEVLKKQTEKKKRGPALDKKAVVPGATVLVRSLSVMGTVLSPPDQRGMVEVQAGILKVSVHHSDLEQGAEEKKKPSRTSSVSLSHRAVPFSLDLHGYNVDEAEIEIDKYLDDAFLAGRSEVTLVHGKGTGALRQGVWRYLKGHPHVASFRAGKLNEGAEGVTVVTLR